MSGVLIFEGNFLVYIENPGIMRGEPMQNLQVRKQLVRDIWGIIFEGNFLGYKNPGIPGAHEKSPVQNKNCHGIFF